MSLCCSIMLQPGEEWREHQHKAYTSMPQDGKNLYVFVWFVLGSIRTVRMCMLYRYRMMAICLKNRLMDFFEATHLSDSMRCTPPSDIVLIYLYLQYPHSGWLKTLLAFCGSLCLHYLSLIVIISCSAGLMITGLATALIDAQLFYKSSEVIDIVPNVVRDDWAGWWCVRSPLNLNKATAYK